MVKPSKPRIAVFGRKTMGGPLIERLKRKDYPVVFSCTRQHVWTRDVHGLPFVPGRDLSLYNPADIAPALDPYIDGVKVAFLAIPTGAHELPLIEHLLDRGIYVILFCKDALGNHYQALKPRRYMLGANATVGGRTLSLPWLRMQYLEGKEFVVYAYWNASSNSYLDGVSRGGSQQGEFGKAQDLHLAEPGSDDPLAFLNGEIGSDYRLKTSIVMNDAILGDGPYMTPSDFEPYVPIDETKLRDLTMMTCNYRYVLRIDNLGLSSEFVDTGPGTLRADVGGFAIRGGFLDMSRENNVTRWIKGDAYNGTMIRFEGNYSDEGTIQLTGLGAGTATVGAALNDLREFERGTTGDLIEARWPVSAAAA